jgi:SAM-dependent methyltransferase
VTGTRRRGSFDEAAEDYNRWRAGYPEEVFEDMLGCAHIEASSRILEVGCGTGQLSAPLANRGIDLLSVEVRPNLAALARQNLARFRNARVEIAAFEDWPLPPESFDAVVVANAFHWLDPDVRYSKSARGLRLGGYLTIGHAHHVQGGTAGFFDESTGKASAIWRDRGTTTSGRLRTPNGLRLRKTSRASMPSSGGTTPCADSGTSRRSSPTSPPRRA